MLKKGRSFIKVKVKSRSIWSLIYQKIKPSIEGKAISASVPLRHTNLEKLQSMIA